MPINPTTLKALIDTQITNETVDFAITPAEVGGRMKDAIDYTTEQSGAKQDTLESGTNIKTINGTSVLGSGDLVIGSSLPYLESSFKVNQSGTSNPTASNYFIDQVRISPSDNTNPLYRNLTFERTAIGEFNIKILWLTGSASAVNITKLDMSIGDGNIKLTSSSNGTLGPFSYIQQNINVYNASGTLSDNEFYTNFYIRLFS
jgi:hypothetical protein